MDTFANVPKSIRVWSLDGGGKGVLSQLIVIDNMMRLIQHKQQLDDVPRPRIYADVMIGTGLGGAAAVMMGRLRLSASETYDEIVRLGQNIFGTATKTKPYFSLPILKLSISSMLERRGYKPDEMMVESPRPTKQCHVIVVASSKANATGYKCLRTYATSTNIDCTIVDAIAATMAVPDWFEAVAFGAGMERQMLIGGCFGYNNPTWEGLVEAKDIFGVDARVTSLISIGSGKATSRFPATNEDPNKCVEQINADCEQTALRLSGYFREVAAYNRFSVNDADDIDISNWVDSATNLVNNHAASYLDTPEIRKDLGKAVGNLLLDVGTITLGKISTSPFQKESTGTHTKSAQAVAVPAEARSVPRLTSYYVRRPEIHEMMDQCFDADDSESQKLLVIQGMAGSGKTQSASFFARTNRRRYKHVFFIDASSVSSIKAYLQSSIRSLGGSHSQSTFEDALLYLQNTASGRWLVIFDNADDPSIPLVEFIPSCDHGHVIVTTRNPDLALLAPTSHLRMPRMEDGEALSVLFLSAQLPRPPSEIDHQNAMEICKLIGSLPLALVQVGCYCYSSKVSFLHYLERYREHRQRLMNMRPGWQLDQYPHSAYTSISLSYSLLDEKDKSLFHLLSFFHPSSIHIDILRASAAHQFTVVPAFRRVPRDDWHDQRLQKLRAIFEEDGKWDQYHVDQLLMRLQTLSLASLGSDDGTIITIHPLVQSFSQDVMAAEDFDSFFYMAVITLSGCIWDKNLPLFRHLFLHISEAESQKLAIHPDDTASFAYAFHAMSLHREAVQRWDALRHRCKEQFGPEHPSTLFATSYKATSLSLLGEYEASANEINSVILAQEKLLGRDHRDTCRSYETLAMNLNCQGKLQEGEVIIRENVEILRRTYGDAHEYTLQSALSLSRHLFVQAKYSEAEDLLRETIPSMRRVYNKDHNVLIHAVRQFSQVLIKCDKWEEAEDVLRSLIESFVEVYGKEHVGLAPRFSDLALCVRRKGGLREAERLQRIALELMEKDQGTNHPRTIKIRESLEETIRMIDQENGRVGHKINGNGLVRVVDYKKHKVFLMILTIFVVLIAALFP